MAHYPYLIIGAGMTADAAARGIRELDSSGAIGMIGADPHPPYNRPPLSKALWKGEKEDSIWRGALPGGVTTHLGRTVTSLDLGAKSVADDKGTQHTFDKLLFATGGTPRRLAVAPSDVIYYRTLNDYRRLRELTAARRRFVVVGGGFIGAEIAAAIRLQDREVVIVAPQEGLCGLVFPRNLAKETASYYAGKGVDVRVKESVTRVEKRGDGYSIRTSKGTELTCDAVVAGLGITPGTELAERAGLQVENGIIVDEFCRTTNPICFAAGDVANFFNPALDTRRRVEHEDNANMMGKIAGHNMVRPSEPYHHLPFFYSDLFELGYEAVGDLDARLETVADWKEPYREGVIYYLAQERVRGVLLFNTWGKVDEARALIADPGPIRRESLKGRI
ncbi:MAG TPA: FAD-dependent oxidoreductase [Gemmatimonadales bacterium]|nr:FAD-dependent oxidoreductase [Gemmatimonadales bacterium]